MADKKGFERSIPHLKCREIQAPVFSSLIQAFAQEIGSAKTIEIVKKVISQDAMQSGEKLAQQYSGNAIAELARIVKEVWARDDAIRMTVTKETDTELFFDVTYCGYAELYEKMGIKELGYLLSCSRDFSFIEGFNTEIELRRTKTIMEGAEYRDFRFKRR